MHLKNTFSFLHVSMTFFTSDSLEICDQNSFCKLYNNIVTEDYCNTLSKKVSMKFDILKASLIVILFALVQNESTHNEEGLQKKF